VNGKPYAKRRIKTRKEVTTFLIVCEGQKTEVIYFEGYRKRDSGVRIFIPNLTDTDPVSLVEHANSLNRRQKYDHTWCVFDADENNENTITQAGKMAQKYGVKIAFSNPCFELWYLLHFVFHDRKISTKEAQKMLNSRLPNYEKNKDYNCILGRQRETAIDNASKLNSIYKKNKNLLSRSCNPSTTVVDLVNDLISTMNYNVNISI
jgi:hypothetical protein